MQWYVRVMKQYAVFGGRASRREFWMFTWINFLIGLASVVLGLIGLHFITILYSLYSLALIIPSLALQVRRLHDTNRTAWSLFWLLVPLVGGIILFIFDVLPGLPDNNLHGPVPPS